MSDIVKKNSVSDDIRKLVCKKYDSGETYGMIAIAVELPYRTVQSIVRSYKRNGHPEKSKNWYRQQSKLGDAGRVFIKKVLDKDCTKTFRYIRAKLEQKKGISVSERTIGRAVDSFNYSFKRTSPMPKRRNDPDVIEKRYQYALRFSSFDESKIFYLDEAGFNVSMRRRYGRSKKGEKAVSIVPAIRSRNISVSAAISKECLFFYEAVDRAYNISLFGEFIDQFMDFLDQEGYENRIIIMDNVRFHHADEILQKIESRGHSVEFLPPYSPFLNPIEEVFSKWKGIVKQKNCLNENDLIESIDEASREINESNCIAYFQHMKQFLPQCLEREPIYWDFTVRLPDLNKCFSIMTSFHLDLRDAFLDSTECRVL
ncbi:uncharacterized protein LOC141851433 [Brevipalpus obovatus]|uniref:uncharacterized protein LOC141851433 n=1 Tax=Brevipalpus obovatus TaxID=246614 RepID=UPI003D9DDF31